MKYIKSHSGKAYLVLEKHPISKFDEKGKVEMEKVKAMRDWLATDHVLRDATHFLFCQTIEDIDFKEDKVSEN